MDSNLFYNLYKNFNTFFISFSKYISDKTNPLYNVFILINEVFKWNNNGDNSFSIYLIKFFVIIIILILPFIILIYLTIIISRNINKNKKYNWMDNENKYNFDNTHFNYIKNLIYINSFLIFSQTMFILFIFSLSFVATYFIIKTSYSSIFDIPDFSKFINYNVSFFLFIFSVILLYIVLNLSKYNNVYNYNNNINQLYSEFLDFELVKEICNKFKNNNGIIEPVCNLNNNKKVKDNNTIIKFLNEYYNKNIIDAKIYVKAIITYKWLYSMSNNNNSYCNSFNIDYNNNMYNIFYCYKETDSFPFNNDIENILPDNIKKDTKLYTEIYEIYYKFNNDIATNISNIKKSNINENDIILFLFIIFLIYFIGLFYIYSSE
ncbi:MAG: hypothetical protein CMM02_20865 [Rhodopirellula sp.]|nr:hypothetical protein [Rhodopirellula sp.]|tara:strand:+ start:2868 stop:3998 length:1131 start_codon:yes stop_codon:yes gene_type:complete